jgi:tRNA-2-methylthio-N6-dimethylallyladenosine synthase
MIDSIVDEEKAKRLAVVLDRQREIQRISYSKQIGDIIEVMVEGKNEARGQWIGRTSQNKTLNFGVPGAKSPEIGSYHPIKVTGSFPNSLVGELVA